MELRLGRPEDAAAGASCHIETWHEAYRGRIAEQHLPTADDLPAWTDRWRQHLTHGLPRWLAVRDEAVVGFANSGPSRDEDAEPDDLELYACYVRAAEYGSGLGATLLDRALGQAPATLWVLRDNPRAKAFYAKHGFEPDGAEKLDERIDAWEDRLRRR